MTLQRPALALLFLLLATPAGRADDPLRLTPDHDGIEITRDVVLEPGTWVVVSRESEGVLRITTDGVTLDLGGSTLRGAPDGTAPDTLTGIGIVVENAKDVTIQNGAISGFKIGIRAVNAPGLEVVGVAASGNYRQRLSSTPEKEDSSDWLWPHDNDEGEWEAHYGAGISLNDCEGASVHGCTVRHGQNGMLLTRCLKSFVYDNDFSFNSGWGIALYRTNHSEVSHNRCDFCVRGYSHGVYSRGQDSAAILVFEQCSHNVFGGNSATHSGDGFFLYAGHETTQRTGKGGSNHNLVFENDFSFAVANGIEATFSEGNVFVGNDCSGCDHGIWAGYSRRSRFLFNRIHDCTTAGVSIEHGHKNGIHGNDIENSRYGVHLWWDDDRGFLEGIYGKTQDCTSSRNIVAKNRIQGTRTALCLDNDVGTRIARNGFGGRPIRLEFAGSTRDLDLEANSFHGDLVVDNRTGKEIVLGGTNTVEGTFAFEGDTVLLRPPSPPPLLDEGPRPAVPEVRGSMDTSYPKGMPRGRDQLRIDEWGPIDPREKRLFPASQAAAGPAAKVHLLGRGAFRVVGGAGDGVTVEPKAGTAPATITVRATADGPALRPFRLVVASDGVRHEARGTLLRMPWDVRWFRWTQAQDPRTKPQDFAKLLGGAPAVRGTFDTLDFPWRSGGPDGIEPDHFATLATSEVDLPAGRYRLRVVSDDGVRLFVDGKLIVERWDHHAPTEDVAEVTIEAGRHAFRIEHFEIDGWSFLSFRMEPVDR